MKQSKLHASLLWHVCACGRERQWKLKQGRKYARAVARSNLNIETRAVLREREAQAAVHRRAAWVAKEVRAGLGHHVVKKLSDLVQSSRLAASNPGTCRTLSCMAGGSGSPVLRRRSCASGARRSAWWRSSGSRRWRR